MSNRVEAVPKGLTRRYTKLQSLHLGGPGSLRPIGAHAIYSLTGPAPCSCSIPELGPDAPWQPVLDRRLQRRLDVESLVEPASVEAEGWVPLDEVQVTVRFPETEYCLGCGLLQKWQVPAGKAAFALARPGKCVRAERVDHKISYTRQLERVWVCPQGHLDSVEPTCPQKTDEQTCGGEMRRDREDEYDTLYLKCQSCGRGLQLDRDSLQRCTGRLPSHCPSAPEYGNCSETMQVRRLGDPFVWQPRLVTSLFMPSVIDQSEDDVLAVLKAMGTPAFKRYEGSRGRRVEYVRDHLLNAGRDLDTSSTEKVIDVLMAAASDDVASSLEERSTALRAEELEQLLRLHDGDVSQPFFAGEEAVDASGTAPGVLTATSRVERLRTTTVLASAGRLEGQSRALLFGHQPASPPEPGSQRLPALEGFGEGILLWADASVFGGTTPKAQAALHSLAHAAIAALATTAGVGLSGIRERLYPDVTNPAVLLYVATGDRVGTLGGLSSLAEDPERLSQDIWEHVQRLEWCSLDPVCSEEKGASCHHCLQLPETCCEGDPNTEARTPNGSLDRRLLSLQ